MAPAEPASASQTEPGKKPRGGARKGGGVKAQDGAKTRRVQLTLDDATLALFKRLGGGQASLGARMAARALAAMPPPPGHSGDVPLIPPTAV